jgi:hypothetical protein
MTIKVKFTLEQAMKAGGGGRSIGVLYVISALDGAGG